MFHSSRALSAATLGVGVIAASTALYTLAEDSVAYLAPAVAERLVWYGWAYVAALMAGVALLALGLRRSMATRAAALEGSGSVPLSPGSLVPYVLSLGKYRRYFWGSTLLYGLLYSFVTSIVVFQPTVDFVRAYGAVIPSVYMTACCGAPFSFPVVTVFMADHLGLLLVPSTLLLLMTVSPLVGANLALAVFVYNSRAPGTSRSWLGGLGAVVGLFTGCPTCAGLFFAATVGGTGAVSFAALLSYYQPEFIAASVPVLVLTLYLASRSLSKVFREGCVYLRPAPTANQSTPPAPGLGRARRTR